MIPRDCISPSTLSNSIFPSDWISSSSTFSGGPVTRFKRTHQWMSGVTMLVRWLCSFPASALLAQVGRSTFVLPRPQEMHPSAAGTREPTGGVISKVTKEGLPRSSRWSCCHWIGQGMHPTSLDKVRVREGAVGPSFSQTATSRVPGYSGGLKKQRQRQATNPEENRQRGMKDLQITKLGDDQQARRRSREESQVAQNGRERVIGQHEEKTQWMRTAKKVQQRKPAPPMRKNRPE